MIALIQRVKEALSPCHFGSFSVTTAENHDRMIAFINSFDKGNTPFLNKIEQEAKADAGKPRLSLVPTQIIYDIARVREYGDQKYGSTDNWKTVEAQRYVDAMFRHLLAFVADPDGRDEESGLPHLWHLECNAAFLSEMMKGRWQ